MAVVLAFFPVGVVIGFAIGWWRELMGGLVSVLSLAGFYVWMMAMGRMPGPYFVLAAMPGILFLAAGIMGRGRATR